VVGASGGFAPELAGVDAVGMLFLTIVSVLFFFAAAIYGLGYLRDEQQSPHVDSEEGILFANEPEAVFVGCLLMFLASMTLVTLSQHLACCGSAWKRPPWHRAADLFHRHHRSLEATWKYLLICSVGSPWRCWEFPAGRGGCGRPDRPRGADRAPAAAAGGALDGPWLRVAFLFFLVGYGTKMGLAPLHTWLPTLTAESPSPSPRCCPGPC